MVNPVTHKNLSSSQRKQGELGSIGKTLGDVQETSWSTDTQKMSRSQSVVRLKLGACIRPGLQPQVSVSGPQRRLLA